jgi:serine/threonine protein kinase
MVRCSCCGLRLPDDAPRCPTHGDAPPGSREESEDEAATTTAKREDPFAPDGYRILGLLGRGGFGTVYRAERLVDGRTVAIKVVDRADPGPNRRLEREGEALRHVASPFVPTILATGADGAGRSFLAMEMVEGSTLADRLVAERGPTPLARFGPIALAILDAVDALHSRGLVHRDLKPENIFVLDPRGEGAASSAKIIDFGSAFREGARIPLEEAADGTPTYMAPEQCRGELDVDPRTDVYSLAILFYEMLTGAPPFWGPSAEVREAQGARRPPRPTAGLPEHLVEVVLGCLAKDAPRRPENAAALKAALLRALAGVTPGGSSMLASTDGARSAEPAKAAPAPREKRTVSLVYFRSSTDMAVLQGALAEFGAHLAYVSGPQHVATLGHEIDLARDVGFAPRHWLYEDRLLYQRFG